MDSYITTEVLKLVNYFVRNSQVILRDPMEKSPCWEADGMSFKEFSAQDEPQLRAVVNTVMNLRVP